MSKTLTIEIPDEVFSNVREQAADKGETAEKFVLEIVLKNFSKPNKNLTGKVRQNSLEELMKFAGTISSGNSRSADNEQIDIDLAEEYGRGL
ncbi:hypothetical protein BH20ACI4_BH20ACI4_16020 [soil metagenome]